MNVTPKSIAVITGNSAAEIADKADAITRAAKDAGLLGDMPITWQLWLKLRSGRFLHHFGVHSWAHLREYDPNSERILHTNKLACLYCPTWRYEC